MIKTIETAVLGISSLRSHSVYSSTRWLTVRELGGRAPYAYATGADSGGSPLGLLPLYNGVPSNSRYQCDHILRSISRDLVSPSPFFVGSLSGYRTDLPTVSSAVAGTAARKLLASARRIAGTTESLVIPYLATAAAALIADAPSLLMLLEGADSWIDVPNCSFCEYADSLRADARSAMRRDLTAFRESGLTTSVEPLGNCVRSFAPLAVQNSLKYGLSASEKNTITYLSLIAEVFGDDAVILAARDGNTMVGGVLGLIHEDTLYLREVGFDYSMAPGSHAYFVLYFHFPVEYAISISRQRIHLGLAVDRTKRTRGGRLEPLWTALINTKLNASQADLINSERLYALADIVGTSQRGHFLHQMEGISGLAVAKGEGKNART